jgi:hypothetical protein
MYKHTPSRDQHSVVAAIDRLVERPTSKPDAVPPTHRMANGSIIYSQYARNLVAWLHTVDWTSGVTSFAASYDTLA